MKKIGRGGKVVDARPFDSTPDEFADFVNDRWLPSIERGSHAFHPRGYSLVPHLEREAVEALSSLWPSLPRHPVVDTERPKSSARKPQGRFVPTDPPRNTDTEEAAFERWRVIWAAEAQFHRVHAHEYSTEHRAAINILVTASQLRAAVQFGEGEKSAALGMLLAFQAIEGGYSLEVEAIVTAAAASRKIAYNNGAGRNAEDYDKARSKCIAWAAELWEMSPDLLISTVAARLLERLQKQRELFPKMDSFPKTNTVKKWLRDADRDRALSIPEAAQRRGRPSNSGKKM